MGLPTSLGASNTEKECSAEGAAARNEYQQTRNTLERNHAVYGQNTRALPNNLKYEIRLRNNRKSAHAVKVHKHMYQYTMRKLLKSMQHEISSRENEQGIVMSGNAAVTPMCDVAPNGYVPVDRSVYYTPEQEEASAEEHNCKRVELLGQGVNSNMVMKMVYFIKSMKTCSEGNTHMHRSRSIVGQTTPDVTALMENSSAMCPTDSSRGHFGTFGTSTLLGFPSSPPVSQSTVKSFASGNLSVHDFVQNLINESPYQHTSTEDEIEPSCSFEDGKPPSTPCADGEMDGWSDSGHPFALEA